MGTPVYPGVSHLAVNPLDLIETNTKPGSMYEGPVDARGDVPRPVRLIAYYLPQFHPIPENDLWWGKGFTEWTNVTKALPRFVDHYQPRLPGDLGFYDLRLPDVLRQQACLARSHGIHGFCFHHYWFSGRRLLGRPLEILLADRTIDLPFCINWANESWSRQWNGSESDLLIEQRYDHADDAAFCEALLPLFEDDRYIRIDGRPLLMVYRPSSLSDARAIVTRWREQLARHRIDPYVVMPQAFGDSDPRRHGMDAAAGFPPHNGGWDAPQIQAQLQRLDPRYAGTVVRYADVAARSMATWPTAFRLFPGVCPQWDNEARRPGRGFTVHGSTPALYGHWLREACRYALNADRPDERVVFVNAWNEWGEGAYLEPDRHFGYAYLNETARVLTSLTAGS